MKLFGFIAESAFTFIPEPFSDSSWNSVRNHPGIAFTLDRIPQFTPIEKNLPVAVCLFVEESHHCGGLHDSKSVCENVSRTRGEAPGSVEEVVRVCALAE